MDFSLRCNSLKCRTQLQERAVVTTCSHIFCNRCSDSLGLTAPPGGNRLCPACQTCLPNPDDAVSTKLNPTEDYKTSVLSGLTPSTIMECAGRGLAFWSYQSTQEIVYQEYLAKTLTDKYGNLSVQMDKIINEANSELEILNQKLTAMQIDHDKLKSENNNLVAAFREKSRKHQQTQELYNRLKRKEMTSATQSAAIGSVDEVLGSFSNRQGRSMPSQPQHNQIISGSESHPGFTHMSTDHNAIGQTRIHERTGSNGSHGNSKLIPSPSHRVGIESRAFESGKNLHTPVQHRTQLGPIPHTGNRLHTDSHRNPNRISTGRLQQTPSQRMPLSNLNNNSLNHSQVRGYGMSAGLKVGRQQGGLVNLTHEKDGRVHPIVRPQQPNHNSGIYY